MISKSLGKIGVKALLFYLVTTALAISVALAVGHLINPGIGLDISGVEAVETSTAEAVSTADTILNIIPENPIAALAKRRNAAGYRVCVVCGNSDRKAWRACGYGG